MSPSSYLAGRLLAAMPGIGDPRFERAVILVCAHDADHAMGLAVNRPVEALSVRDLLDKLGLDPGSAPDAPVMLGGPVETERGFVLHSGETGCPGETIAEGVVLSATRDALEALAGRRPRPRRAGLVIGYAGWDAGQLDREIRDNIWLTCEPDENLIFDDAHETKWARALAKIGVSADRLSAQPGRA